MQKAEERGTFKMVLFQILLAFSCVIMGWNGVECMQFVVVPNSGTESVTKLVTFGCRSDVDAPREARELLLIQITKGDEDFLAMLRGDGKISHGDEGNRRIEASGAINNNTLKGGYLDVRIHFPSFEDTGIYKCHVMFLDDMGVARHFTNQAFLDVDRRSNAIEKRLRNLELQMAAANKSRPANIETTTTVHAFSAAISRSDYYIEQGEVIVFDAVTTQSGRGYDPLTGTFTAPVAGLYAFFVVIEMEGKEAGAGFSLQTPDYEREFARLYVEDKDVGDQSSVSAVVNLVAGEEVRVAVVYTTGTRGFVYFNKYSVFSGYLIKAA